MFKPVDFDAARKGLCYVEYLLVFIKITSMVVTLTNELIYANRILSFM